MIPYPMSPKLVQHEFAYDEVKMLYQADVGDALREFTLPDGDCPEHRDYVVPAHELYRVYKQWKNRQLAEMRYFDEDVTLLMNRVEFGRCFNETYPDIWRQQVRYNGKRVWVYRQVRHETLELYKPQRVGRPPRA